MKNLWNDTEAKALNNNLLDLRVYTSRLLGQDPSLVLHGGGNTSVKIKENNFFGEPEHYLYVKGSGWDLATIERAGFAAVKMDTLLKMAKLPTLSDTNMVKYQKAAMTDPGMPAPSVEAILHALIPHTFVDHTHADAIVGITNSPNGTEIIQTVLGKRFLYLPYIMPGFILARQVEEFTKNIKWENYDGMILMHHGIFTFAETAKAAYDKMIEAVSKAEDYIKSKNAFEVATDSKENTYDFKNIATLRKEVSKVAGNAMIARKIDTDETRGFVKNKKLLEASQRGPLTPDHSINTKRICAVLWENKNIEETIKNYVTDYTKYFNDNKTEGMKILEPSPRYVLIENFGAYAFGASRKRAEVARDIAKHSMKTWQWAEKMGGWKALSAKDIFDVEYWELEQAKLKAPGAKPALEGKIALVTGAANGIGKACVEKLVKDGAVVVALDISPKVKEVFASKEVLPIVCDLTKTNEVKAAIQKTISEFGGLDIVISNAGTFPAGKNIEDMDQDHWQKIIEVNLNSHQYLLHETVPFLKLGVDPTIIFVASKNVKAPGPGAAAYSAAKAGLTQLARVASMELANDGIRVNVIHPNAVFDTGIWTEEVLQNRAKHYGMTVDQYKRNNFLKVEITSHDVANLAATMAGNVFSKITAAQINIDGGNDRTI